MPSLANVGHLGSRIRADTSCRPTCNRRTLKFAIPGRLKSGSREAGARPGGRRPIRPTPGCWGEPRPWRRAATAKPPRKGCPKGIASRQRRSAPADRQEVGGEAPGAREARLPACELPQRGSATRRAAGHRVQRWGQSPECSTGRRPVRSEPAQAGSRASRGAPPSCAKRGAGARRAGSHRLPDRSGVQPRQRWGSGPSRRAGGTPSALAGGR